MLKLDKNKIEESIGFLKLTFNDEILEKIVDAVNAVRSVGDDNPLLEQYLEAAMNVQNTYNSCLEGVDKFLAEAGAVYDIAEFMDSKKSIGEVNKKDASFDVSGIDSSMMMV